MRHIEYKGYVIVVTTGQQSSGWAAVQVRISQSAPHTCALLGDITMFDTEQEAIAYGVQLGKVWVDLRLVGRTAL